jgi:hypothetical protein
MRQMTYMRARAALLESSGELRDQAYAMIVHFILTAL